ncbi:MAG: hypothetical protein NTV34_04015, partial [Proteobacteria bacterium]|nr:hypothetical protein [Pseudomonadota bacterium]
VDCAGTYTSGNCATVSEAVVSGKKCDGNEMISPGLNGQFTKLEGTEVRVRCGTSIGANRLLAEYRDKASANQSWRDINRGIPWICGAAAATPVISLAAPKIGGTSACGIGSDGNAYCWGINFLGSLGNSSVDIAVTVGIGAIIYPATISHCPVKVIGLVAPVQEIQNGYGTACAKDSVGWKCWGAMKDGMPLIQPQMDLVNGVPTPNYLVNISKEAIPAFTKLPSAPDQFTLYDGSSGGGPSSECAIVSGRVWCWGVAAGGLGVNGTTPFPIGNIDGVSNVATAVEGSASQGCAIVSGGLMCWQMPSNTFTAGPQNAFFIAGLAKGSGVTGISGQMVLVNGKVYTASFIDGADLMAPRSDMVIGLSNNVSKLAGPCVLDGDSVKCYGSMIGNTANPSKMLGVGGLEKDIVQLDCNRSSFIMVGLRCRAKHSNGTNLFFGYGGDGIISGANTGFLPPRPLPDPATCPGFGPAGSGASGGPSQCGP